MAPCANISWPGLRRSTLGGHPWASQTVGTSSAITHYACRYADDLSSSDPSCGRSVHITPLLSHLCTFSAITHYACACGFSEDNVTSRCFGGRRGIDSGRQAQNQLGNEQYTYCLHFSICACNPCAGAMLIFSTSLQLNG